MDFIKNLDTTYIKLIETVIVFVLYFIIKQILFRAVSRHTNHRILNKARGVIVRKSITAILVTIGLLFTLLIWGVDQKELAIFMGSVLTVIGIALFAQWSILSNITAGIILFFNHSVKIDEEITILDKDYQIEGYIKDIGLFFVIIKTKDNSEISIPSNVFMQKMVSRKTPTQ
jgi:small-conductance mechanosensitive channel